MGTRIIILAVLAALWTSSANAEPKLDIPPPVVVTPLPAGTPTRSVTLTQVMSDLTPGSTWAHIRWPVWNGPALKAKGGPVDIRTSGFAAAFYEEMKRAGFKTEGDPSDLFETPSSGEFAIGASIQRLEGDFLSPVLDKGTSFKGKGVMEVEWQVYSRLERRVLARIHTTGGIIIDEVSDENINRVLAGSFRENVRGLADSGEFRRLVVGSGPPTVPGATQSTLSKIVLRSAAASGPTPITDAVKSVVVVFAGDGHGSGFLISSDGLVLTDQHVVGDARYVKLRWSDGVEGLGEVLRSDRIRDTALIKTDPRGRQPLRLRTQPLVVGDAVIAIGAPLGEEFQGTVTRGVFSANRTFNGLTFLQSDVTVNPGNSGGPLLDEQGAVVGMTESGIRPEGAPSGLNLFTPIGDALHSLNAQTQ